ncbi:hypothetical protein KDW_45090 [Dictyobacter vulcani]|uniref:Uncharacterized protein n=1 Tax=Dictyobacter vulcani TaxID=2607529 RepID=A0A5J4KV16_9CHLR|nr:hypothetical protein [Dictyobacter vulcani]GER90347.1 hypothetical protein KDW_45090 [Dictyobacter vulcani]
MKTYIELQTISVSYQEICSGAEPWLPLGNFMNDFFGNFTDRRVELLRDPIQEPLNPTEEQHRWAVFCAASVEYLCQKYDLPVPTWTSDPAYAPLPEPWYHSKMAHKPAVQQRLLRETPEAFAKRNIYCGGRVFANKYELAEELRQRQSA